MPVIDTMPNESARLEALYSYQILDSGTDADFDGIAELASLVCNTPIALITFIDQHRQWFKAKKGLNFNETTREESFCKHTIMGDDIMIVKDTLEDDRFAYSPFVTGGPQFRFYAGVPLTASTGHKLGTLCVLDKTPGKLSDKQIADLKILARQVINLLDLRIKNLQLQNLLKSKTSELSHVFDRIGEAFLELDKDWNYIYVNKRLGELVHRDPASLIGKNVWAEFPEAVGSASYKAFHQAMKEQRYICHIDYYAPLNLWQENHIYPSATGLAVFIRDISERKSAEQRLTKSIQSLERAEEQAKMGSWYFDLTSGKRTWSKQLFIMFGFVPADEAPSFNEFVARVHPEDQAALTESFIQMKQGIDPGESIIKTNPHVLPLRYVLRYTRAVRDEKGSIIAFEGIMIDITELKKTNQELDRFVYSISHDLRAPLSTILGLIKVAELEHPQDFDHTYYKTIRDQINRLDSFIRDILDYSFNARTGISKDKIDFLLLMERVTQRVKPFILQEKIKVDVEVLGNSLLYSDRARLEIILNNLYSNSIKFQDTKKELCHIQICVSVEEDTIVIQYSDNGIGIEDSHLDKIFNMFYRASNAAKGSGLGLYIAKETVTKLGGKIKVSSELDMGTTFEIRIPNQVKF